MKHVTSLAKVKGLGPAKQGLSHWWLQRLTAIALIPLTLWFVVVLVRNVGLEYHEVRAWLAAPMNTLLLTLFVASLFHHAQLGVQVVIEDYIHRPWLEYTLIIWVKFMSIICVVASFIAMLKLSLGNAI